MEFLIRTKGEFKPDRVKIMRVYRDILKQARSFFDETTRDFITTFAKKKFRANKSIAKGTSAYKELRSAITYRNLLERANKHRYVDVISVLQYGYGQKGPRRYVMLKATAGISRNEKVFGSLHQVSKYRPAFYAIAKNQFGQAKLQVSDEKLRSRNLLNIAKMQDRHWDHIRKKILPPIDPGTTKELEQRAVTGVIDITKGLSPANAEVVRRWESQWVKYPYLRDVKRFYRELLDQLVEMRVETEMVENPGLYRKGIAKRNTQTAQGVDKSALIPKSRYVFSRSSVAGKPPPSVASSLDLAGFQW